MFDISRLFQTFKTRSVIYLLFLTGLLLPSVSFAAAKAASCGHGGEVALVLASLGVIVVLAKIAGAIAERFKQISVLGELLLGIILGIPILFGFDFLEGIKTNEIILTISKLFFYGFK